MCVCVETQHVSSWLGVSYSKLCSPLVFKRCGEAVSIRVVFSIWRWATEVFVVLFILKANSGVAVKRDHHSLCSHPSQFFHNHHFEVTVLAVWTIVHGCINSGRLAG
jgi:hypothetical protein